MSRALSLAGFQVTLIGRFWVTPEEVLVDAVVAAEPGCHFRYSDSLV
jgi:hypothetical protein